MRKKFEVEAARMRERAEAKKQRLKPLQRKMTLDALASIERQRQARRLREMDSPGREDRLIAEALRCRNLGAIHPEVMAASADELIAAGWEAYDRHLIPPEWRTRKPASFVAGVSSVH